MSDVKWTEGEWRVVERVTNGVNGYEICWSGDGEVVTDHVYEEADAHVMAASKELYSALDDAFSELSNLLGTQVKPEPRLQAWYAKAGEALAKARGEQQ